MFQNQRLVQLLIFNNAYCHIIVIAPLVSSCLESANFNLKLYFVWVMIIATPVGYHHLGTLKYEVTIKSGNANPLVVVNVDDI